MCPFKCVAANKFCREIAAPSPTAGQKRHGRTRSTTGLFGSPLRSHKAPQPLSFLFQHLFFSLRAAIPKIPLSHPPLHATPQQPQIFHEAFAEERASRDTAWLQDFTCQLIWVSNKEVSQLGSKSVMHWHCFVKNREPNSSPPQDTWGTSGHRYPKKPIQARCNPRPASLDHLLLL